jgi:hypothetical protein
MGLPDTTLTAVEILGMRITDTYTSVRIYDLASLPFEALCAKYGWRAPWLNNRADMEPDNQQSNGELSVMSEPT